MEPPSQPTIWITCALSGPIYHVIGLIIYRLWFSPISRIPGPRLAAISYLYQFYYDFYPYQGQFMFHCGRLHEKYGPVVRIGPDEVHINDMAFYHEMYTYGSRRRHKSRLWFWFAGLDNGGGLSTFATLDHDLHRLRRAAFSQYFTRSNVAELQPRIVKMIESLRDRIVTWEGSSNLLDLHDAFSALTLDVVTDYVFGQSVEALQRADLGHDFAQMNRNALKLHAVARAFPTVFKTLVRISDWLPPVTPSIKGVHSMNRQVDKCIDSASSQVSHSQNGKALNVMQEMVSDPSLPKNEKTLACLRHEGTLFIGAGMETTARTLTVTYYHLIANPHIRERLEEAIRSLLYLTAVVHEGLRMSHGTAGRLARVAPDEHLICNGHVIPRGVTMSQSTYLLHMNPEVFSNPEEFHPERFLAGETYCGVSQTEALKHLIPFSKGSRMCAGVELAYAEIYLTIALLIISVRMEVADVTTLRDVSVGQEHFVGMFPDDSKGVKVKVLGAA